jgi:hypothetical protein
MNAPVCPGSRPEPKLSPRPAKVFVPPATDLPSLIVSVNIIRQILIDITTGFTVNNLWGRVPRYPDVTPDKFYSKYPLWDMVAYTVQYGAMYHHASGVAPDPTQKAYVRRLNTVVYRNEILQPKPGATQDPQFYWSYTSVPLDSPQTGSPVFEEDFFERIVSVTWGGEGLSVEFYPGSQ